jgi:hypothetical protein
MRVAALCVYSQGVFLPDRRAFSVPCNTEAWCVVCFNYKKETVSDSSIEITRREMVWEEKKGEVDWVTAKR